MASISIWSDIDQHIQTIKRDFCQCLQQSMHTMKSLDKGDDVDPLLSMDENFTQHFQRSTRYHKRLRQQQKHLMKSFNWSREWFNKWETYLIKVSYFGGLYDWVLRGWHNFIYYCLTGLDWVSFENFAHREGYRVSEDYYQCRAEGYRRWQAETAKNTDFDKFLQMWDGECQPSLTRSKYFHILCLVSGLVCCEDRFSIFNQMNLFPRTHFKVQYKTI